MEPVGLEIGFTDRQTAESGQNVGSFERDSPNGSKSKECGGAADSNQRKEHGDTSGEPDGTNRELGARVGVVEELGSRKTTVTSEREQHAGGRDGNGELTAVAGRDNDCHDDSGSGLAGGVVNQLHNGLRVRSGEDRVDVLDGKEHAEKQDEAGDGRDADRKDDALGGLGVRVLSFFGKMGRSVVAEVGPAAKRTNRSRMSTKVLLIVL